MKYAPQFGAAGRGGGLATCGVNASGGLGFGFATAPGAGLTSIGGGNGVTCCWAAGGCGAAAVAGGAGRGGAAAFGCLARRGSRPGTRGSRPGNGALDGGAAGGAISSAASFGIEIGVGGGGGGSPRSMASSLFVSWSIARTASQDDNEATSTLRVIASGVPAANNWISGRPLVDVGSVSASAARRSAWSAGMS